MGWECGRDIKRWEKWKDRSIPCYVAVLLLYLVKLLPIKKVNKKKSDLNHWEMRIKRNSNHVFPSKVRTLVKTTNLREFSAG